MAGPREQSDGVYRPATPPARDQPLIVYQAGLGDGAGVWNKVMARLPDLPQFAFTRAGYGGRPEPQSERDPCTVAAELHSALRARGLNGPYVLVGHSLGGQYQYAFARLYPSETAGIVLVDATHPDHWEAMQREAKGAAATIRVLKATAFSQTMRREFAGQGRCLDSLPPIAPTLPARILAKTRWDAVAGPEMKRFERKLQQDWLRLTGASVVQDVAGAGHYIQRDQPDAVVRAIREIAAPR